MGDVTQADLGSPRIPLEAGKPKDEVCVNDALAARIVRDLNFKYLSVGKGAPVTARFGADGITIVDPNRASDGKSFQKIYEKTI